jgi:hypothetical protein
MIMDVRSGLRGCLRRCAGKSSSDGNLPKYAEPSTDSQQYSRFVLSNAFGLASAPVSLKPSQPRPLPGARNESTAFAESLRAVERVLGKKPGALSVSELSHVLVRVDEGRLADSRTDGIELLSPCGDSAIISRHCADSRSGKSMGRILGGVFQICSRAIRTRVAGDLRTGSGAYGRGTANKMWVVAKFFLLSGIFRLKMKKHSRSQKNCKKILI